MHVGRSKPGPIRLLWCRSDEMMSGGAPAASMDSATVNEKPPEPWPTSNRTPRSRARSALARRLSLSFISDMLWPVAQCVTRSPGRNMSSTSSISGGPAPMWAITGRPATAAAWTARRRGSKPISPVAKRSSRHLTPITKSLCSSAAAAHRPGSHRSRRRASPVSATSPIALILTKARVCKGASPALIRRSAAML